MVRTEVICVVVCGGRALRSVDCRCRAGVSRYGDVNLHSSDGDPRDVVGRVVLDVTIEGAGGSDFGGRCTFITVKPF